jgi:hypothetical protein
MLKITYVVTALFFFITLPACSVNDTQKTLNNGTAQWDFDHNIQFRRTQLAAHLYQLELIPNNRVNFDKLAAFLLRESHIICGSYHYKIEVIQGVEGFDDKRVMPNYIAPSLIAKLECNSK